MRAWGQYLFEVPENYLNHQLSLLLRFQRVLIFPVCSFSVYTHTHTRVHYACVHMRPHAGSADTCSHLWTETCLTVWLTFQSPSASVMWYFSGSVLESPCLQSSFPTPVSLQLISFCLPVWVTEFLPLCCVTGLPLVFVFLSVRVSSTGREISRKKQKNISSSTVRAPTGFYCVMFVQFCMLCRNWRLLPTFAFQSVALLGVCSNVVSFPECVEPMFIAWLWSQVLWLMSTNAFLIDFPCTTDAQYQPQWQCELWMIDKC